MICRILLYPSYCTAVYKISILGSVSHCITENFPLIGFVRLARSDRAHKKPLIAPVGTSKGFARMDVYLGRMIGFIGLLECTGTEVTSGFHTDALEEVNEWLLATVNDADHLSGQLQDYQHQEDHKHGYP